MLVSVILPAYNAEQYLTRAIDSILAQSFTEFELIVINDGSTDDTRLILDSIDDPRLKTLHLSENGGLINALNLGLKMAKGCYIARMDADDISLPDRFAQQVRFLQQNSDYVACGTSIINFTEDSDGSHRENYMRYPESDEEIRVALYFFERNICHPTVMFRRSAIVNHDICYRKEYPHAEDYRFWVELSKAGKLYNLSEGLVKYHRHQDQISAKYYPEQISISKQIVTELLKEVWPKIDEQSLNSIIRLCIHQQGAYPDEPFPLKEVKETISRILELNLDTGHFDERYLRRLLYFKRFRCSFYYFYRFNYLTKLRCFTRFFSNDPKRGFQDLVMLVRVFYMNKKNKW